MHSKSSWLAVVSYLFFLVSAAVAQLPGPPVPSPTPPAITGGPHIPTPTPVATATPSQPSVNPDQSIPVVISYGQGVETRVQIYRNIMEPVGVLPNQSVTVTLFLTSSIPGTPVKLGLYDGGQVGAAAPPGQNIVGFNVPGPPGPIVSANQTIQFNFQGGRTLGLYRVLLTVGPSQYLLQFYAGYPRSSNPAPVPTPNLVPPGGQPRP
jgi:hypothetical protein